MNKPLQSLIFVLTFWLSSITQGFAQPGQAFTFSGSCSVDGEYCYAGVVNGRNSYVNPTTFFGPVTILWNPTASRWEYVNSGGGTGAFNTTNSSPNPPTGLWTPILSGCNPPGSLSGPAACTALPVELITFEGNLGNKGITLTWQTASETNNEGFEVQYSSTGLDWQTLDFIEGNGTTQEQQSYEYMHQSPGRGTNYYRLKQIDFDSEFEYSKTISVDVGQEGRGFWLSPNPASEGNQSIRVFHRNDKDGVMTIFNQVGQQIFEMNISKDDYIISPEMPTLSTGVYTAVLQSGRERMVERLIVK